MLRSLCEHKQTVKLSQLLCMGEEKCAVRTVKLVEQYIKKPENSLTHRNVCWFLLFKIHISSSFVYYKCQRNMSAIDYLVKAVEYDLNGRKLEALKLYQSGIAALLQICKGKQFCIFFQRMNCLSILSRRNCPQMRRIQRRNYISKRKSTNTWHVPNQSSHN